MNKLLKALNPKNYNSHSSKDENVISANMS